MNVFVATSTTADCLKSLYACLKWVTTMILHPSIPSAVVHVCLLFSSCWLLLSNLLFLDILIIYTYIVVGPRLHRVRRVGVFSCWSCCESVVEATSFKSPIQLRKKARLLKLFPSPSEIYCRQLCWWPVDIVNIFLCRFTVENLILKKPTLSAERLNVYVQTKKSLSFSTCCRITQNHREHFYSKY